MRTSVKLIELMESWGHIVSVVSIYFYTNELGDANKGDLVAYVQYMWFFAHIAAFTPDVTLVHEIFA